MLTIVYRKKLQHVQELQKCYNDKYTKPKTYTPEDKDWFTSKYIMTKQNCKLQFNFFESFRVLYPEGKQVYKLELPMRWRIHDVFHVFLLEQDNTKKGRVDKKILQLEFKDNGKSKGYEVEAFCDSTVNAKESESDQLLELYYQIS